MNELDRIPLARQRNCCYCYCRVDSMGRQTHKRVEAWIPCASGPKSHAGNTVTMAKDLDTYICLDCYDKLKRNIHPDQLGLFE